jgi:hypothetical protein
MLKKLMVFIFGEIAEGEKMPTPTPKPIRECNHSEIENWANEFKFGYAKKDLIYFG